MPRPSEQLASRFRRAVLYVVESLGEVGTTKLQKILYLADLEHFYATGTTLTGARWVRYTHGPMAKALRPSIGVMDSHEVALSMEPAGRYESRVFRPGPAPRFRPDLSPEERETLDRILQLTRPLSMNDAMRLAYNTAPMLFIQRLEEARGGGIMLDIEIPFELELPTIAASVGPTKLPDADDLATFKRAEFERIRDIQDRATTQPH